MVYVTVEKAFIYTGYVFDSLLDYDVSKQIHDKLNVTPNDSHKPYDINRPSRRSMNYFYTYQKSFFDMVIYAVLSFESYLNKIGHMIEGEDYYSTKIERLPFKDKLNRVLGGINVDIKETLTEVAEILHLVQLRNTLVHDKPVTYFYYPIEESKTDWLDPTDIFKTMITFDILFKDYSYKDHPVRFISDIIYGNYDLFMRPKCIKISADLPFNEALFSDVNLYRYYLRQKIGFDIPVKLLNDEVVKV